MKVGSAIPSHEDVRSRANRSFVRKADFMPEKLVYWSCGPNDSYEKMTGLRTSYVAHHWLQMALPLKPISEDTQFLLPYTESMLSTTILIEKSKWNLDGRFEVICFEPDIVDGMLYYRQWTGLEYTVSWAKIVSCKPAATFKKWETDLEQSHFDAAARVFIDFLVAEFSL